MVSLTQIFDWFKENLTPSEVQFRQTWSSFWHKSERLPITQVLGLNEALNDKASKTDLANATTNDKGIFGTDIQLKAAYPPESNIKGFYAFVGSQNPFRKWEVQVDGGQWVPTLQDVNIADVDLTGYAKITTILNVSQINNKYDYATNQDARNAVPSHMRAKMQFLIYTLADDTQVFEQYVGNNMSGWNDSNNWKSQIGTLSINLSGIFSSKTSARNAVPDYNKVNGLLSSYKLKKTRIEQVRNRLQPVSAEQGKSVTGLTGVINTSASNNQIFRFNFTTQVSSITLRGTASNSGAGGSFFTSAGIFISGFTFTPSQMNNGDFITVNTPSNAAYLLHTYVTDAWGAANNVPKLEYADTIKSNEIDLLPEKIVDKYVVEKIAERIQPVSAEQGKSVTGLTGVINTSASNNQIFRFNFTTQVLSITLRGTGSSSGAGGSFFTSAGIFISGFTFTTFQIKNGDFITVNVPSNAAYLLHTYVTDVWGAANGVSKLEYADVIRLDATSSGQWVTLSDNGFSRTASVDDVKNTGIYLMDTQISASEAQSISGKYLTPAGQFVSSDFANVLLYDIFNGDAVIVSGWASSYWSNSFMVLDKNMNVLSSYEFPAHGAWNTSYKTIIKNQPKASILAVNYSFVEQRPKPTVNINRTCLVEHNENEAIQIRKPFAPNTSGVYERKRSLTGVWSDWVLQDAIIEIDSEIVTPNMFENGTQIERINLAVDLGISTGKRTVIPKYDSVTKTNIWSIDSAIILKTDTYIELENCHIQQSNACRDNIFRTVNVNVGNVTFAPLKNIHIKGIGKVVLEGANNPRATGDWHKKLTLNSSTIGAWESYGSDAGKSEQNQYGGWLNNTFCLVNTSVFSIDNVIVREPHAWGMMAAYCANGVISNITIEGNGYRVINGVKQYIKNQGAFIAVQGCHDIEFNNFYGYNSDDIIEIGTLLWTAGSAEALVHVAGNQNNISPTGDIYKDVGDDTYNIVIRNIFAKAEAENVVYALIKFGASNLQKQYNITVDNVFSTKPALITFDYYNTNGGKSIAHSFRNIGSNISFWCKNANATIPKYSTFRDIWFVGTGEIFDTYILNGQGNVFENTRKISI